MPLFFVKSLAFEKNKQTRPRDHSVTGARFVPSRAVQSNCPVIFLRKKTMENRKEIIRCHPERSRTFGRTSPSKSKSADCDDLESTLGYRNLLFVRIYTYRWKGFGYGVGDPARLVPRTFACSLKLNPQKFDSACAPLRMTHDFSLNRAALLCCLLTKCGECGKIRMVGIDIATMTQSTVPCVTNTKRFV